MSRRQFAVLNPDPEPNGLWPSFDVIWWIVENTSKNGNLLFNIFPRPDGTIGDDYSVARYRQMVEGKR